MIVLAFGISAGIQAQSLSATANVKEQKVERGSKMTAEERAKKHTAKMTEALELSEKQQKAVYQIALDRANEVDRTRQQREEMQQRRAEIRDKSEARIMDVLTPEQQKKWEAQKAERMQKRENRGDKMRSERRDATRTEMKSKKDCAKECTKTCDDKKK